MIASSDGKYEVSLVRQHERLDWGFAIEHDWTQSTRRFLQFQVAS